MTRRALALCLALVGCRTPADLDRFTEPKAVAILREIGREETDLAIAIARSRTPSGGSTAVLVAGPGATRAVAPAIRTAAERVWNQGTAGRPAIGLTLLLADSAAADDLGDPGLSGVLLPAADASDRCVVFLGSPSWWRPRPDSALRWISTALGPCLFWGRFGRPGTAMAGWLRSTGYRGVLDARPLLGTPDRQALVTEFPWGEPSRERAITALLGADAVVPYFAGPATIRCLKGEEQGCRGALLTPPATRDSWRDGAVILTRHGMDYWDPTGRFDLGLSVARWTGRLLRDYGEDRFRQLWQAGGTFEEAFQRVYGSSPGSFTADLLARERRKLDAPPVGDLGVSLDLGRVAAAIGWALGLALLPLLAAGRRIAA